MNKTERNNLAEFCNEFERVNKRYNNVIIIDGRTGQTIKTSTDELK